MPKKLKTTEIEGVPFGYLVTSSDGADEPHTVHLLGMYGNGWCSCKDFQARCIPNIRIQQKANGDKRFKRIDYIKLEQVELFNAEGKKKHFVIAKPNPLRTRCKHHQPCQKRVADPLFKKIAEEQNHGY